MKACYENIFARPYGKWCKITTRVWLSLSQLHYKHCSTTNFGKITDIFPTCDVTKVSGYCISDCALTSHMPWKTASGPYSHPCQRGSSNRSNLCSLVLGTSPPGTPHQT